MRRRQNEIPGQRTVERLRSEYPTGTIVELVSMNDPQSPKPGTRGRVLFVDDVATVHIAWQTGSSLGAAYGEDVIRKVCPICDKPYTDPPALSRTDNKNVHLFGLWCASGTGISRNQGKSAGRNPENDS